MKSETMRSAVPTRSKSVGACGYAGGYSPHGNTSVYGGSAVFSGGPKTKVQAAKEKIYAAKIEEAAFVKAARREHRVLVKAHQMEHILERKAKAQIVRESFFVPGFGDDIFSNADASTIDTPSSASCTPRSMTSFASGVSSSSAWKVSALEQEKVKIHRCAQADEVRASKRQNSALRCRQRAKIEVEKQQRALAVRMSKYVDPVAFLSELDNSRMVETSACSLDPSDLPGHAPSNFHGDEETHYAAELSQERRHREGSLRRASVSFDEVDDRSATSSNRSAKCAPWDDQASSIVFVDDSGDLIKLKLVGRKVHFYLNGEIMEAAVSSFKIDVRNRTYSVGGGGGGFTPQEDLAELQLKRDAMWYEIEREVWMPPGRMRPPALEMLAREPPSPPDLDTILQQSSEFRRQGLLRKDVIDARLRDYLELIYYCVPLRFRQINVGFYAVSELLMNGELSPERFVEISLDTRERLMVKCESTIAHHSRWLPIERFIGEFDAGLRYFAWAES